MWLGVFVLKTLGFSWNVILKMGNNATFKILGKESCQLFYRKQTKIIDKILFPKFWREQYVAREQLNKLFSFFLNKEIGSVVLEIGASPGIRKHACLSLSRIFKTTVVCEKKQAEKHWRKQARKYTRSSWSWLDVIYLTGNILASDSQV